MMKHKRAVACFLFFFTVAIFAACNNGAAQATILEMELTGDYDTSDPFIHEKLIYVSDDVDVLELGITFQMEGESGILEIADNETGEVFWSDTWNGDTAKTGFAVVLDDMEKEREYVVRFTGTKITYAKIVVVSEDNLVQERARPQRADKGEAQGV